MIKTFEEVIDIARKTGPKTVAVACAQDAEVLSAVNMAYKAGIINAILVGDKEKIVELSKEENIDINNYEIIDIKDLSEASLKAVELVSSKKAHIVMKGLVDTSIILKAVLNKEVGLRTGSVLSHVAVFSVPTYHKLLLVTDAAMNLAPNVEQKKQIIENSLYITKGLEIENPKVAVVCAKEKVNPKMQATVDAAELQKMNENGEIKDCIVGGPFGLDNAINKEAAEHKGIDHIVAGDADVLLFPYIEAGNVFYKSLSFLANAKSAGVIVGAKAPIVLTSRAETDESKLNSIALAVLMASKM